MVAGPRESSRMHELSLSLPRCRVLHEVRPSCQQLFHADQREKGRLMWRTQRRAQTLGAQRWRYGDAYPWLPANRTKNIKIPPALPGLGGWLCAQAIQVCAWRGPGSAEPTAGTDARWPREDAGATTRYRSPQASGGQTANTQTPAAPLQK